VSGIVADIRVIEDRCMRVAGAIALSVVLAACSTARPSGPREYLDEQTAATITVVSNPWIFTREQFGAAVDDNDFLNLYAIDVNRMGDHRQYLAVLQSVPLSAGEAEPPAPQLDLRLGDRKLSLQAVLDDPRSFGIAQPIASSYTLTSRWWFYPVSKETLTAVASATDLNASLTTEGRRIPYVIWRDGRAEVAELMAVLP
jgi:hypothetical protein